jgi:hypothetical protein
MKNGLQMWVVAQLIAPAKSHRPACYLGGVVSKRNKLRDYPQVKNRSSFVKIHYCATTNKENILQ